MTAAVPPPTASVSPLDAEIGDVRQRQPRLACCQRCQRLAGFVGVVPRPRHRLADRARLFDQRDRAFEIGFLLFLPFLIIDLVVASVLMSMGMMMLPPVVVSLPFKLIFFVLVDGWSLVAGSLIQSYGT